MAYRAVALTPHVLTQPQLVALRMMKESPTGQVMWVRNFFGRGADISRVCVAKLTADKLVELRLATRVPFEAPKNDRGVIAMTAEGLLAYENHRAQYSA